MRKLIWGPGVLALLWCAYWAAGSYAIRTGVVQGLSDAVQNGSLSQMPAVQVRGFPTAFDLGLQGIDMGDPATGLRWQTPTLQMNAALWRPWHVVALLADTHVLTLPDQDITLTADDVRASLTVTPDLQLGLSQFAVTLTQLMLQSSQGWQIAADVTEAHANLLPDQANAYKLVIDCANLRPDPAFAAATGLENVIATTMLDGVATLSAPLDRDAGEMRPELIAFTLTQALVVWGDMRLDARGQVFADAQGLAEGRIDIEIYGWRALIGALVATGTITPEAAPTIEGLLGAMAAQGGNPDVLSLPLVFANGRGTLGPLPLGVAPRLRSVVSH